MESAFENLMTTVSARVMTETFSDQEKDRRNAMDMNWDFFYGDQSKYVDPLSLEASLVTVNLTKPIVSKRTSLLYGSELVREVTGPSASINALEQIWADNDFGGLMLKIDRLAELTGSVMVMPRPDPALPGGIRYITYNGRMISAIGQEDDPNKIEALCLVKVVDQIVGDGWRRGSPQVKKVMQVQIWTDEFVSTYRDGIVAQSEENELGFIPFTNFQGEEMDGSVLGVAPATEIRRLNQHFNQGLSDLMYTVKMQAATPLALEGYQSGAQITLHPGRAISLPVGAKAHVIDFRPQIEETLEVLDYIKEQVYETSRVPKVSIIGGEASSGRELMVKWFPLLEVFNEKSVRFQKYELDLANTTLRVLGLPEVESIHVMYPESDILPLSAEDDNVERDIELGIISPIDVVLRENPEMTRDEASSFVRENLSFRVDRNTPAE